MKNAKSISKSRNACIKHVMKHSFEVNNLATKIYKEEYDEELMAIMRVSAEKLLKYVHEYSAYSNVELTR